MSDPLAQARYDKFQKDYFATPVGGISQLAADAMIVIIDLKVERDRVIGQAMAAAWDREQREHSEARWNALTSFIERERANIATLYDVGLQKTSIGARAVATLESVQAEMTRLRTKSSTSTA